MSTSGSTATATAERARTRRRRRWPDGQPRSLGSSTTSATKCLRELSGMRPRRTRRRTTRRTTQATYGCSSPPIYVRRRLKAGQGSVATRPVRPHPLRQCDRLDSDRWPALHVRPHAVRPGACSPPGQSGPPRTGASGRAERAAAGQPPPAGEHDQPANVAAARRSGFAVVGSSSARDNPWDATAWLNAPTSGYSGRLTASWRRPARWPKAGRHRPAGR